MGNLQDGILHQLKRAGAAIELVLLDGARIQGKVKGFDSFTVILDCGETNHLIYKHAVAQIIHQGQFSMPAPSADRGERSDPRPPRPDRPEPRRDGGGESRRDGGDGRGRRSPERRDRDDRPPREPAATPTARLENPAEREPMPNPKDRPKPVFNPIDVSKLVID